MTFRTIKSPSLAFWTGLLGGLAAPASMFSTPSYMHRDSALQEVRSDWQRIGDDFRAVMSRENVEAPNTSK
jgi:hypothetical protein